MQPQIQKIEMFQEGSYGQLSFEKIMMSPQSSSNSPSENRKKLSLNVHAKAFEACQPNQQSQTSSFVSQPNLNSAMLQGNNLQCSNNLLEHLDVVNFKTQQCTINSYHNHKLCIYFHNLKDRRRKEVNYFSEICPFIEKPALLQQYDYISRGNFNSEQIQNIQKFGCPQGDYCTKAHNRVEVLYHFDKYKKRFCSFYPKNIANCEYGKFCSFAHTDTDIQIELIHNYVKDTDFYIFHYKTEMCPYNFTEHDKSFCVYAHNWQDYRRKPHIYDYDPIQCQNWNVNDFVVNYEQGCQNLMKCDKSHGWKENEFHPLSYKTRQCLGGKNCQNGKDCPFYHSNQDKRIISPQIQSKTFKFTPRNRMNESFQSIKNCQQQTMQLQNLGGFEMQVFEQDLPWMNNQNQYQQQDIVCSQQSQPYINSEMPMLQMEIQNRSKGISLNQRKSEIFDDNQQVQQQIMDNCCTRLKSKSYTSKNQLLADRALKNRAQPHQINAPFEKYLEVIKDDFEEKQNSHNKESQQSVSIKNNLNEMKEDQNQQEFQVLSQQIQVKLDQSLYFLQEFYLSDMINN